MTQQRLGRAVVFLSGSIVGGLALAFLIVFARPGLLRTPPTAATPPPAGGAAAAAAPAVATPSSAAVASYADAVARAAPAVANIYSERLVKERLPPATLGELFGDVSPRYRERIEQTLGSGVVVDLAGHIVTNHHVIDNAERVSVQLADGRQTVARIVGRDPDTDLAVLKVDLGRMAVMPLGRSDQLRVGDVVLAIGNPVGLTQSVTQGIVSGTGRGQLGVATFENFIQTDAPINFGNSGGALVNSNGELVGINTAVLAKSLGVEGIGFAIPVNLVRGVMQEILEHGRVIRGSIGVALAEVDEREARALGLARAGVVITNLIAGSPAVAAGLLPGDIVTGVAGNAVHNQQEALTRIAASKPGDTIALAIVRGNSEIAVSVKVTERRATG
ncbi:MAG TPA: trypsin-like peptidase domain-containing protein [Steroidobacteraceae bacterium]|nr:trypsin-like peptidase domain-containing protein [Steroidobacteraceae bacterium]HQW10436.1 trypsin-like peptidase domain-containing protein [Steroidobacteraceae bacterium]HQX45964.1 trypsin-like peptidase domain-containing protein [Steroidobacteraceae bacterium]HQX78811.1 trypsin-like peptidase domain-containing protein [Steroidobacteraceae bacterium]HQZ80540.1 trypsin-like peptidase domain-containing protein [Steroidobacteraceae bacterium]